MYIPHKKKKERNCSHFVNPRLFKMIDERMKFHYAKRSETQNAQFVEGGESR